MHRRLYLHAAFALTALAILSAVRAAELAAPYVPTAPSVVERMLEIAKVGADDYVIDLGSGDGRINILAATKYGARGHGLEIDRRLIAQAEARARAAAVTDRVTFEEGDLFAADLSKASVVTMYLMNRATMKLRDGLFALAPGTRIVSHAASMGEWKADHFEMLDVKDKVRPDAPNRTYIHFWIVPAKVAGTWAWPDARAGARECELQLGQHFQFLEGIVFCDGSRAASVRGRLDGTRVTLEIAAEAGYEGLPRRVDGVAGPDTIAGAAPGPDGPAAGPQAWRIVRQQRARQAR